MKSDITLLKRLVEIRFKMKELEEEIVEDMKRYWELQYKRHEMKSRFADHGTDSSGLEYSYNSMLKESSDKREIKEKTLADMKKLYEEI